jgi:hypothetical protein
MKKILKEEQHGNELKYLEENWSKYSNENKSYIKSIIKDLEFCEEARGKLVEVNPDKYLYLHFKFNPDTGYVGSCYDKSSCISGGDKKMIAVILDKEFYGRKSESDLSISEEVKQLTLSRRNSESRSVTEEVRKLIHSRKSSQERRNSTDSILDPSAQGPKGPGGGSGGLGSGSGGLGGGSGTGSFVPGSSNTFSSFCSMFDNIDFIYIMILFLGLFRFSYIEFYLTVIDNISF